MISKLRPALCLLALVSLSGCFGKKSSTNNSADFDFFKTDEAKEACVSTNLSQWELTGKFLHGFFRCASNKSADGAETLSGLQALLVSLDETKLQKVLDFALTVDPKGATHEERYPYLLALSTVLDRGLIDSRSEGLNLSAERLGSLQDFLVTFDARRSKEILSTWSRSGRLAEVLNELGLFVDSVDNYSVEVFAHEMLSGNILRPEALSIARRVLKEESLFLALADVTNAHPSRVLNESEQTQLLAPYRETIVASDKVALAAVNPSSEEVQTPLSVLNDEHAQYSLKELTGLKDFLLSYWKAYQNLGQGERDSLDSRLSAGMDTFANAQAAPAKWSLAMLHDGFQMAAQDLSKLTYAADLLIDGNDLPLEAIRAKSGASKLMNQLEVLLTNGGKIPNCPIFDKSPLALDSATYTNFAASLKTLTEPHANCAGRVPLLVAIETFTGFELSENYSPELSSAVEADAALTRKLTTDTLTKLVSETQRDPYRFYNLQLATDRLESEFLVKLSARIQSHQDWSMAGIAKLDESLTKEFEGILEADFLEKLLTHRIEALATQAHQFKDLAPEQATEIDNTLEARSSRVFAGLYTQGPIEQVLGNHLDISNFTFSEDQQDLKSYLQSHPSVFSRLMFKARESEGIFRSPTLGTLEGETFTAFSGAGASLRTYFGFTSGDVNLSPVITSTAAHRILAPNQAVKAFSDDEQGRSAWALWYQQYGLGPIDSKDVPSALSKKLEEWFFTSLIPTLSNPDFYPELKANSEFVSSSSVSPEYFDIEGYSPEEARLLTTFYYKHYQKSSPLAVDAAQIAFGKSSAPRNDLTAFADPIAGFFNTSYMVKDEYEGLYSAYAKTYPKALRSSDKISALKASILPDYATFQTTTGAWTFAEQAQVNDVTRLPNDIESPLALLSTLDLLTYSKPQSRFIPQPVVGFAGTLCRSRTKDPNDATIWVDGVEACPIDFQGASPDEAYGKFREYISQSAAQTFCPFLASDELGPRMIWSQRLGLSLDNSTICSKASNKDLLADYRFPAWHSARVLDDIFVMGRQAKLKAGLSEIPAAIRFYKIKSKGLEPARQGLEFLALAKGVWTNRQAADQRRREFFAGNLWVGSPSLLNSYINFVSQNVDSYGFRNSLIAYAETDASGQRKDTLRDILRVFSAQQKESAAQGESAILFGLKTFDKIVGNPEFRAFIANGLADTNSSESYNFFANELPMSLVQLFPADENPFDWSNPGLSFLKNIGQHSMLRSGQIVSELFTASEIDRFLEQTVSAVQVLPDVVERATLLTKAAKEVLKIGTLANGDSHLTEKIESLAKVWARIDLGQEVQKSWTSYVTKLVHPLKGFDGEEKISGQTALDSLLSALIIRGPSLFSMIQDASQVDGSALKDEPLFWRNWFENLTNSMDIRTEGSFALSSFLSEKRFGVSVDEGGLWLPLLRPGQLQDRAVAAIAAMDSVPEPLWQNALIEMTDLSARLTRALGFLKTNLVWNVDPDHNAYRIALDKAYELSQDKDLRDKQIELITLWLSNRPEPLASNLAPRHGAVED